MKKPIGMPFLLALTASATPQPSVPLCDLVHNAKDYNGKEVTVSRFLPIRLCMVLFAMPWMLGFGRSMG